jgi:sigma-54 dependent transcriptional regulator, acetoin dehydrogenase operon transcriptional activator AcoR
VESTGTSPLRPEIASAWRRAELCGLDPGRSPGERDLIAVDGDSALLTAALPVLDRAVERLSDTRFSLLLADRDSRIVDRRFGHPSLAKALDDVLAVPGNLYSEDNCGTNALSTAVEIRRGIAVHGEERFFDRLKGFTCYGSPIVHPVTGRLEGVLDVTGFARDATPVLQSFATLVVAGIEERLLLGHGLAHQRMLAAFQERTARTRNRCSSSART